MPTAECVNSARIGICVVFWTMNQDEKWSSIALTVFDAEARFRLLASRGDRKRALAVLDKLDDALGCATPNRFRRAG